MLLVSSVRGGERKGPRLPLQFGHLERCWLEIGGNDKGRQCHGNEDCHQDRRCLGAAGYDEE